MHAEISNGIRKGAKLCVLMMCVYIVFQIPDPSTDSNTQWENWSVAFLLF